MHGSKSSYKGVKRGCAKVSFYKIATRFDATPLKKIMVLLQFSWRRGAKGSRDQGFKGLFSKDFISAFNILSISAMSFFSVPNSPFSIKSKSPANNICVSNSQTEP